MENKIEIPFGAKDSELKGWEYTIPENMEAEIKDGKIIVKQKESEDEKIRKELLEEIAYIVPKDYECDSEGQTLMAYQERIDKYRAYLEKQKEPHYSPLCNTVKDKIREYMANHFIADAVVKTDMKSIVNAMEEGVRLGKEEQKRTEGDNETEIQKAFREGKSAGRKEVFDHPEEYGLQKELLPIPDKFSGLKSLMLQYLQSAANRKDDSEIESDTDLWGRKILGYVWKYDEKQKEQKPVEMDNEEIELSDFESELFSAFSDGWQQYLHGEEVDMAQWAKEHSAQLLNAAKQELRPVDDGIRAKIISRATSEKQVVLVSESNSNNAEIGWDTRSLEDTKKLLEYGIAFINKELGTKPAEWNPTNEDIGLFNKAVITNTTLTPSERAKLDIIRMKFRHCSGKITKTAEWNEEDEKMLYSIIEVLEVMPSARFIPIKREIMIPWLKSLPQRFNLQSKQEWSEDWREEDIQTRFAFYTYKDDPSVLYLSNVFVEETSRNHGFGTKILRAAEKVAEAIGATTISLKVKQDSPANAWYRKNGYGYMAFEDGYDWLEKNLEYMKPNKREWSEEDTNLLNRTLSIIRWASDSDRLNRIIGDAGAIELEDWLKSLRQQSR